MKMAPGGASFDEEDVMASSKPTGSDAEKQTESDEPSQLVCLLDDNDYEIVAFAEKRKDFQPTGCLDDFSFTPSPKSFSLNTKQLKNLLDEAFAYKNPKDRVGKSQVFLHLLSEAENAEKADEDLATSGRRTRASESNVAGGSLQNISQAVESDSVSGVRRRQKQYRGSGSSVSARQKEGGSLPCNVNAGWSSDLPKDGEASEQSGMGVGEACGFAIPGSSGAHQRGDGFLLKPSDTSDDGCSPDIDLPPTESDEIDGRIMNPDFRNEDRLTYLPGNDVTTDSGSSHLDDLCGQPLFRTSASFEVADEPIEGAHMNGCPDALDCQHGHRGADQGSRRMRKSDECQGLAKASSSKKSKKKNKNVALSRKSEETPGYRGNMDLDTLLNFIENNGEIKRKQLAKQKLQEKKQKDISKAISLEELSQRNIEDLTEISECDRRPEQVLIRSESQQNISTRLPKKTDLPADEQYDSDDCEFQMVRKKHRRRRGAELAGKRVRHRGANQRSPRRKSTSSVPPSERSAESDLDSVHSLPAHGFESDCDGNDPPPLTSSVECQLRTEDFPCLPVKRDVTKHDITKNDEAIVRPEAVKPKPEPAKPAAVKIEVPKPPPPKQGYKPIATKTYFAKNDYPRRATTRQDSSITRQESTKLPTTRTEPPKAVQQLITKSQAAKTDPSVSITVKQDVKKAMTRSVLSSKVGTLVPQIDKKPQAYEAPPAQNQASRAEPKMRSKSVGPNTRPPVILMDDKNDETTHELTFGFEVNETLVKDVIKKEMVAIHNKPTENSTTPSQAENTVYGPIVFRRSRYEKRCYTKPTQQMHTDPKVVPPPTTELSTPPNVLKPVETEIPLPDPVYMVNPHPGVDLPHGFRTGTDAQNGFPPMPPNGFAPPPNIFVPPQMAVPPGGCAPPPMSVPTNVYTPPQMAVPPSGCPPPPIAVAPNGYAPTPIFGQQHVITAPPTEWPVMQNVQHPLNFPIVGYEPQPYPQPPPAYPIPGGYDYRHFQYGHRPGVDYSVVDAPVPYYYVPQYIDRPDRPVDNSERLKWPINKAASTESSAPMPAQPNVQQKCANCGKGGNTSRRTLDVATSTEDLETVIASQQSVEPAVIPPVAENPAENLVEHERDDCSNEEECEQGEGDCDCSSGDGYDSVEEDVRLKRENPHYPYANQHHVDLAEYNRARFEEAKNSPDSVYYDDLADSK